MDLIKKKDLKSRSAFTLIELLIVLAIIGALMSIGIPIYTGALDSAKATVVASNIRTISDGVRMDLMLNNEASKTASKYIQLDNTEINNYHVNYSDTGDEWRIEIGYNGNMATPKKIKEKLKGCNEKLTDSNSATCVVEVPKM